MRRSASLDSTPLAHSHAIDLAGGAVVPDDIPVTRIEPSRGWVPVKLGLIWQYRDLLLFLVWRDISIRYKQTLLGASWAIIQPFFTMVVFSIFFGQLAKVPSDGLPYPIFAYTALLPWQLFSNSLTNAGNSIVSQQGMVSKVYFPRLVMPLSAVLSCVVDFCVAFTVLLAMMAYYQIVPTMAVLLLPALLLLTIITALAVGLWLSALTVYFRDFRYTIPFLVQFLLFLSPVVYPSSMIPEQYRMLYGLNPMVGVIEGFRWAMLGSSAPDLAMLAVSLGTVAVLLVSGLYYFRRMESTFADVV